MTGSFTYAEDAPGMVRKILTQDEAQDSVIYMYLPQGESGGVVFSGSDSAESIWCSNFVTGHSKIMGDEGKVVHIDTNNAYKRGGLGTLHIKTKEGRLITIVVTCLGDKDVNTDDVVAKVVIH